MKEPSARWSTCLVLRREASAPLAASAPRELTRAESRVAGLKLKVLAAAEKANTAHQTGAASTGQWAARLSHSDGGHAQRQVELAGRLERRTATQQALADGQISPAHAEVICHADRRLPATLTAEQRARVEAALLEKALVMSPTTLRRAARRTLHGHLLGKILETMTAPRRARHGACEAQSGPTEVPGRDWDHARGVAFCELVEHLPTDHLHRRSAATVVVTIDDTALRGALSAAGLDTGDSISSGQARRLACNAGIIPAVLGGRSPGASSTTETSGVSSAVPT